VLGALAVLILANGMMHAGAFDYPEWAAAGKRLAIAVIVMLISFIGGRIIPSFTANWLRRAGAESFPASFDAFDRGTLALSAVALSIWVVVDLTTVSGAGLILAAAAHAVRLARWRGGATTREALLWILHLGYAWLPIGLALLGAAAWRPGLATGAIHALTVGAMGTMTLAVMTRASLGHSQRPLTAGAGTLAVYLLVLTAAVARIAAPLLGNGYMAALEIAAGAWIAAFALFLVLYGPLYIRRPSRGASG
jgi:uncharacterized protein involved in response to NO